MTVRLAGVDDLESLRSIWMALGRYYTRTIGPNQLPPGIGPVRSTDDAWRQVKDQYRRVLEAGGWIPVVEARGRIVAFGAAIIQEQEGMWGSGPIMNTLALCALPLAARPAAELIGARLRQLGRERGVKKWTAMCLAENATMRSFFEAEGGKVSFVIYHGVDGGGGQ